MATRRPADHRPLLIGLGLVAVGIVALADQFVTTNDADLRDALVFGGLAAVFIVALVATSGYGFLIAGMALAGLSAAKYAVMLGEDSGGAVLLGPGLGLLLAYAVGAVAFGRGRWWPLVPGTILTLLGGLLVFGGQAGAQLAGQIWPIVLIGIGLLTLAAFAPTRRSREAHRLPDAPP